MTSSSQAWKRPKSPSAGARSLISHLQPGQKIVPAQGTGRPGAGNRPGQADQEGQGRGDQGPRRGGGRAQGIDHIPVTFGSRKADLRSIAAHANLMGPRVAERSAARSLVGTKIGAGWRDPTDVAYRTGIAAVPAQAHPTKKNARRSVSRVLSPLARGMAIHLRRPSPDAWCDQPGRPARKPTCREPCGPGAPPLFGLAPGGVCRAADVTAGAVRSYRTLSPLPASRGT